MSVLSVGQLTKSFGADLILDGISFQIHNGERVGLVGPNGAGKTTLLRIIAGQESADAGTVALARGTSLGYLEQGTAPAVAGTMEEELRRAFGMLEAMAAQIKRLEEEMAGADSTDSGRMAAVLEAYGKLRHSFEAAGGYSAEARLRNVTSGLGFAQADLARSVNTFSGGERTRLRLARLLLEEPDLLLLDEPTNHLDISAVEWLEKYLADWRGTVLIVSHDRYFLDKVAGRILAMENNRVKSYTGNYSAYTAQRELERVTLERSYRRQQDFIAKESAYIRTLGTSEREKRQAGSRQKRLEKLETLERPRDEKAMSLDFGFSGRSGDIAVRLVNVAKKFGEKTIFSNVNAEIRWGHRVALLGPNGAGKTTLLKMIAGELEPDEGSVWLGPSVRMVYFDQHQRSVSPDKTPLDEIMEASDMTITEARTYLGRFLFSGDDVFKKNADLSGGERSRLALAKLGLDAGNFLVLDEPTNHLDIRGVEELESALDEFPGTLLVVTHDRYFVRRTTDKVLEVEDGKAIFYKVPYEEYLVEREKQKQGQADQQPNDKRLRLKEEKQKREEELTRRRERRKLEQAAKETEEKIARTEEKIAALEAELATPEVYGDFQLARAKGEEMASLRAETDRLYTEWDELVCLLEEA